MATLGIFWSGLGTQGSDRTQLSLFSRPGKAILLVETGGLKPGKEDKSVEGYRTGKVDRSPTKSQLRPGWPSHRRLQLSFVIWVVKLVLKCRFAVSLSIRPIGYCLRQVCSRIPNARSSRIQGPGKKKIVR